MSTKIEKISSIHPIEKPANGKTPIGPALKNYPEKPANAPKFGVNDKQHN